MPRLLIKSDDVPGLPIELKLGVTRLGRSSENDFQINHPTLSGNHCEIVVLNGTVLVRDCGSTNGTFIDGNRIKEATLQAGQALHLGEVEMELDPTPPAISVPDMNRPKPAPVALPDGSPPCANHAEVRAGYRCIECQQLLCPACIHKLRRVGGKILKLCPTCSGHCEPFGRVDKRKKNAFLTFLAKTLKMPFKDR